MSITPSSYLIALIIAMMCVAGFVSIIGAFKASDPTFLSGGEDASFNATFNKLDTLTAKSAEMQAGLSANMTKSSGILDTIIGAGYSTMATLSTGFSFMNDVYYGFATYLQLPKWVADGFIAIITISLVFALIGAVFRYAL